MKKNVENDYKCNHKKQEYTKLICSPLDMKLRKYLKCFEYFLYYAPNVAHNKKCINENKWNKIYASFLSTDQLLKTHNKTFARETKEDYYSKLSLDGNKICFECPRLVMLKKQKQDDLSSLLTHLRNALAHGNIYYYKSTKKIDYIFFEDIDGNKLTARILLTGDLLLKLKEILEKELKK